MAEKTKTIGIMGGGQLGLMIVEQAHLLGARTLCLPCARRPRVRAERRAHRGGV